MAQVASERALNDEIGRLRRDIERAREELGDTLAALEDRASPKRIAERSKARAKTRVDAARRSATAVVESLDRRVVVGGVAVVAALVIARFLRR